MSTESGSTSSSSSAAIAAGRVSLNHVPCLKADRTVAEGDVLTVRGLGKRVLREVGGLSRKGRTAIVIEKYL